MEDNLEGKPGPSRRSNPLSSESHQSGNGGGKASGKGRRDSELTAQSNKGDSSEGVAVPILEVRGQRLVLPLAIDQEGSSKSEPRNQDAEVTVAPQQESQEERPQDSWTPTHWISISTWTLTILLFAWAAITLTLKLYRDASLITPVPIPSGLPLAGLSLTQAKTVDFVGGTVVAPLIISFANIIWFNFGRSLSYQQGLSPEFGKTTATVKGGSYSLVSLRKLIKEGSTLVTVLILLSAVSLTCLSNILAYQGVPSPSGEIHYNIVYIPFLLVLGLWCIIVASIVALILVLNSWRALKSSSSSKPAKSSLARNIRWLGTQRADGASGMLSLATNAGAENTAFRRRNRLASRRFPDFGTFNFFGGSPKGKDPASSSSFGRFIYPSFTRRRDPRSQKHTEPTASENEGQPLLSASFHMPSREVSERRQGKLTDLEAGVVEPQVVSEGSEQKGKGPPPSSEQNVGPSPSNDDSNATLDHSSYSSYWRLPNISTLEVRIPGFWWGSTPNQFGSAPTGQMVESASPADNTDWTEASNKGNDKKGKKRERTPPTWAFPNILTAKPQTSGTWGKSAFNLSLSAPGELATTPQDRIGPDRTTTARNKKENHKASASSLALPCTSVPDVPISGIGWKTTFDHKVSHTSDLEADQPETGAPERKKTVSRNRITEAIMTPLPTTEWKPPLLGLPPLPGGSSRMLDFVVKRRTK
jgi:hypothetical protein